MANVLRGVHGPQLPVPGKQKKKRRKKNEHQEKNSEWHVRREEHEKVALRGEAGMTILRNEKQKNRRAVDVFNQAGMEVQEARPFEE